MGGFFRIDGPFFKYGTLLADLIILTVMWMLFSLPIITMGASTAALYYVTTKQVSEIEGYVTKDFIKAFKDNLKQGTVTILIIFLVYFIVFFNITHLNVMGGYSPVITLITFILFYETTVTAIYAFPMMARFKMSLKEIYTISFSMANRHVFTSITGFALMLAILYVSVFYQQILIFLTPGLYAYITSLMIVRIFKKYKSDFDAPLSEYGDYSSEIIDDINETDK
ncbi:MAG: YesL family protein [Firmicutes bacterium]|nr:YesL family protein [Bacillota bacterium]